ncbi:MAG: hypothetical protein EBZ14_10800, partial [Gammaproteobacteria bacterium]|nr:hypothetical protein [Gammaproteobacteria bacterium]
ASGESRTTHAGDRLRKSGQMHGVPLWGELAGHGATVKKRGSRDNAAGTNTAPDSAQKSAS